MGTEAIIPDIDVTVDNSAEQSEGQASSESQEGSNEKDSPYSPKHSREYSQWLKSLRETNPELNAKFARVSKDNHSRLYQLHQMEPRGVDGIRETYALLDSVVHGELKGAEAIGALQDAVREYAEIDNLLASGDPRALESLGEEFNEGLAKLAPSLLDRVAQIDPEAYSAAVLPHFVEALKGSELVGSFNKMVDVIEEQPPAWLTADQKQAWGADRMQRIIGLAANMGKWFNAQDEKAAAVSKAGGQVQNGKQPANGKQAETEQSKFYKEQQEHHWKTNINPKIDAYGKQLFREQFAPFSKRLRLDTASATALQRDFETRVAKKSQANPAYMAQIQRIRAQKNPAADAVLNLSKVEANKYAKSVMQELVNERYKPFLNGKPKPAAAVPQNGNGARKVAPPSPGIQVVSVKPSSGDIDFKRTSLNQIHNKTYVLKNGKVVQVR